MDASDHGFIRIAIEEARKSASEDARIHPFVGVVVAKAGKELARSHRGEIPGNHAEFIALEKKLGQETLAGSTVYTTLEPCPMCAAAVYWAKIRSVFFATSGKTGAKYGFNDDFIRNDLAKSSSQRIIPHFSCDVPEADKVLEDWSAAGLAASQPFGHP